MDFLDRIAEPLAVIGAFAILALIAWRTAQCIRAFVQGINEGDDPLCARQPPPIPDLQQSNRRRSADVLSLKTTLIWIGAYLTSVVVMFVYLTSGGWVRLSYEPEMLVSLVVPLLVLRLFTCFLRLGRFFVRWGRGRDERDEPAQVDHGRHE